MRRFSLNNGLTDHRRTQATDAAEWRPAYWPLHPHRGVASTLLRALAVLILPLVTVLAQADSGRVDLPRFPSVSPDGSEMVFSWGGDLWRASTQGGEARRLTRHHLDDLYSSWDPDGERLVFASMRDGYMNLWAIGREGTGLEQLTYSDRFIRNPSFGVNHQGDPVITFSSLLEADVYRDQRPYVMDADGGAFERLHNAFGSEPQLSPDGRHVAFTRGGYYHNWSRRHYRGPDARNVWLYDREEQEFQAITHRDGDDGMTRWQDENTLVFMSDRALNTVNLYRIRLDEASPSPEPLTAFEGKDIQHYDVSRDGSTAVLQVWDRLYRLDLTDSEATPQPITLRAGEDGRQDYELRDVNRQVSEARLSPDGEMMAYIARGRVYVRHTDEHSPTRAVTPPDSHARYQDLQWSPDGLLLYFTSDQDGTESLYRARVQLTREEIRNAFVQRKDGEEPSVVSPRSGALDGQGQSDHSDSNDAARGSNSGAGSNREPQNDQQSDDPDDPFAPLDPSTPMTEPDPDPTSPGYDPQAPSEPDPDATPDTSEPAVSDLDEDMPTGQDPSRWHDAVRFSIRPVVQTEHNDREASPSPDGRHLAFRRGLGDLMIMDLRTGRVDTLVEGWDSTIHWRWSPNGRYLAYSQNDLNFSANIFVVPVDGSRDPVNITRHPRNDLNPRWSADGRILSFMSNRSGDTYDLYRVSLDQQFETMSRGEINRYYRESKEAADRIRPLPVRTLDDEDRGSAMGDFQPHLQNAWRRIERVTSQPGHQTGNEMTPGGDRYVFNSGDQGLFVMNWDGSERRRLGPRANVQHLTLSGDRLVFITNGRVGIVNLANANVRHVDISDRIRVDLTAESLQKFHEAARMIREHFYRQDMKGLDWDDLVEDYAELISRTRTASEFSDISNRLMGELAASHMGVSNPGPGQSRREPSGRLGTQQTRIVHEDGRHGYRITDVIPGSPADLGAMRLQEGDVITEIDLQPFSERDTLLQRLRGRVGQEVIVTIERPTRSGYREQRALLTPVDYSELSQLRYDAFREQNRQKVSELSDGRLGYIHIQAMNQSSLEEFQGDLYAAAYGKDGLIIDVRNNGGGSTTDRILTSIMAGDHAYTIPAGADSSRTGHYPQDRLDAPRYTLPINMLINEKSYSNAEILAHAFRNLDRGTLVGEQTYGGVISTGSYRLIDGATVRRPFRGWFQPDGTDMEHNGAIPHLRVVQTPEDEIAGADPQLRSAIDNMLTRIDAND